MAERAVDDGAAGDRVRRRVLARPVVVGGAARWLNGDLAELAWYPYQLSAAQVSGQWNTWVYGTGYTPIQDEYRHRPRRQRPEVPLRPAERRPGASYTDGDGGITTYGYDAGGFPLDHRPRRRRHPTGYDVRGNLVSKTTCQYLAADDCSTSYWSYYPDDTSATLTPDRANNVMQTYADGRSASATDTTYQTHVRLRPGRGPDGGDRPAGARVPDRADHQLHVHRRHHQRRRLRGAVPPAGLQDQETTPGGAVTTTCTTPTGISRRSPTPTGSGPSTATTGSAGRSARPSTPTPTPPGWPPPTPTTRTATWRPRPTRR